VPVADTSPDLELILREALRTLTRA